MALTLSTFQVYPTSTLTDSPALTLRLWYGQQFLDVNGNTILPGPTDFYISFNCSVANSVITVTGGDIFTTLDAQVSAPQSISVFARFYQGNTGKDFLFSQWFIPATVSYPGGVITFDQLTIENEATVLVNPPDVYWTSTETKSYFNSLATNNNASTTVKGITKLSIAPVSATNPIALGVNDYATALRSGVGKSSVTRSPTSDVTFVETTDPRVGVVVNATDSTATIQSAITDNRTVSFNAGAYSLTAVLSIPSNTTLAALGSVSLATSQSYLFALADQTNISIGGFNYGAIAQNAGTKIFSSTKATNYSISGFNNNGPVLLKSALTESELIAWNRAVGSRASGVLFAGVGAAVNEFRTLTVVGDSVARGFGLTTPMKDNFVNGVRESLVQRYGVEWTQGYNFNLPQDSSVTTNGTIVGTAGALNNGNGICGRHISLASGQTITFSIKASAVRAIYTQISGGGTFSLSVNGSSPVNTDTNGATVYGQSSATSIYYAGATGYADYPIPMNVTITGVSGNSIIEGYGATGRNPGQGFTVNDASVDGDSTTKLVNNLQRLSSLSSLSNLYRQNVIVLNEWTNDIYTSSGPQVTPQVYEANLRTIIANIQASRTGVYGPEPILMIGLVPATSSGLTPPAGQTTDMYRAVVYKLAYENGYQVIDCQAFITGNYNNQPNLAWLYQADGLHPNEVCQELIAKAALEQTNPDVAYVKPGAGTRIGNFNPTVSGESSTGASTYNSQYGMFVRSGAQVTIQIFVDWATATGTGNILIGNLPYAARNTSTTGYQTVTVFANSFNYGGTAQITGIINPNESRVHLYRVTNNVAAALVAVAGTGIVGLSAVYYTDDNP